MGKVTLSLSDESQAKLDAWADSHDLSRTAAVELLADVVAGGTTLDVVDDEDKADTTTETPAETENDTSDEDELEVPDELPVKEARRMWTDAKQSTQVRLPILAAAVRHEGLPMSDGEMRDIIEEVTVCSRGYWVNYRDKLAAHGFVTTTPLRRRVWVTDSEVRAKVSELADSGIKAFRHLPSKIEGRDDLLEHFGIDFTDETAHYSPGEERKAWADARATLRDVNKPEHVQLVRWALERFVDAADDEWDGGIQEVVSDDTEVDVQSVVTALGEEHDADLSAVDVDSLPTAVGADGARDALGDVASTLGSLEDSTDAQAVVMTRANHFASEEADDELLGALGKLNS